MSFIDLLTNPAILIFIIMFLSSLFKSDTKKKQQQNRPTPRKDVFSQPEQMPETIFDQWRREIEKHVPVSMPKMGEELKNETPTMSIPKTEQVIKQEPVIDTMEKVVGKNEQQNLEDELLALQFTLEEKKKQNQGITITAPIKFTRKKVIEGIIMSEILGPPKAKKAYPSNFRR